MDAVRPGSPWPGYIKKAVDALGDKKIYTHFFSYKNTPGHPSYKNTPGHPSYEEQQLMADNLIAFIDEQIHW